VKRVPTTPAQGISLGPSTFVLLSALPFVLYLFASAPDYRRALEYIVPGLGVTALITVLAYGAAVLLGLGLAGLLLLKCGRWTPLQFAALALVAGLASAFFFSRAPADYTLIGSTEGRVAILTGTPARVSSQIQSGAYGGEGLAVRSYGSVEAALAGLEDGTVSAAFLPSAAAPAGAPVLWQVSFLPPSARNPALLGAVLAVLLALLSAAGRWSGEHPLRIFAELYIDMIRGIPMLVIILYVGFPLQAALRDATGGALNMPILVRGGVAIALGYAAYLAEIFRAGIEAVPSGQREAARSLGLSSPQTARFIVLPQALRIVTPPLGNEFIAMLKDTSLLSVLGVRELTQLTREYQATNFQVFPPFNSVAILYIALTLVASSLLKWLERRTNYGR
jgi:polar amino acid transport system permease protein